MTTHVDPTALITGLSSIQPAFFIYTRLCLVSARNHLFPSRPSPAARPSLSGAGARSNGMAAACSPGSAIVTGRFLVLHPPGAGTTVRLQSPSVTTATKTTSARCAVAGSWTTAPEPVPVERRGRMSEQLAVPPGMVDELVEEALVWCSQHGLVVGDKNHPVRHE